MIEDLFTNKCMTIVGPNGRALRGADLDAPELALQSVVNNKYKVWTDRNGNVFYKKGGLFSSAMPLLDSKGEQVRICGKRVSIKAKFCSKCGAPAPGSQWRCSGCGKMIGSESRNCPHCGKDQKPVSRIDISNGSWLKNEAVLAERFDIMDIAPLINKGLNVFEGQRALLLDGGAFVKVIEPGFFPVTDILNSNSGSDKSVVFVDATDFKLPVAVKNLRTADDMTVDLQMMVILRFNAQLAKEFIANVMGNSLCLTTDSIAAALGYDELAHAVMPDVEEAVKAFCAGKSAAELCNDAGRRQELEESLGKSLSNSFRSSGFDFVCTGEAAFTSGLMAELRENSRELEAKRREYESRQQAEAFEEEVAERKMQKELDAKWKELEFRKRCGEFETASADWENSRELEAKRREIELIQQADDLANNAVRRDAMKEHEMDEFVARLAHEKELKEESRKQELQMNRQQNSRQNEKSDLDHQENLREYQQERQFNYDRKAALFEQELNDLKMQKEFEHRLAEKKQLLEEMQLDGKAQELQLAMKQKETDAEIQADKSKLDLDLYRRNLKLEMERKQTSSEIETTREFMELDHYKRNLDLDMEKKKSAAEIEMTREYLALKQQKQVFDQNRDELIKTFYGEDSRQHEENPDGGDSAYRKMFCSGLSDHSGIFAEDPDEFSYQNECPYLKVEYNRNLFFLSGSESIIKLKLTPLGEQLEDLLIFMEAKRDGNQIRRQIPVREIIKKERAFYLQVPYNPGETSGKMFLVFYIGCKADGGFQYYQFPVEHKVYDSKQSGSTLFHQLSINQEIKSSHTSDVFYRDSIGEALKKMADKAFSVNEMIDRLNDLPAEYVCLPLLKSTWRPEDALIKGYSYPTEKLMIEFNGKTIYLLNRNSVKFGRDPGQVDLLVRSGRGSLGPREYPNSTVSRKHAEILYCEDAVKLFDYSSHGTYINGRKPDSPGIPLDSNSIIEFGDIHWKMNIQKCHARLPHNICQTCTANKVKSVTFTRMDSEPEYYLLIWQCCELGQVIEELSDWTIFSKNGCFFIRTPDQEFFHLRPWAEISSKDKQIKIRHFEQN